TIRSVSQEHSDRAPRFFFVQPIQVMASSDTGFAAGTLIEINFEGVLLPRIWLGEWDKVAVIANFCGNGRSLHPGHLPQRGRERPLLMRARESNNWHDGLLLGQQSIDQRPFILSVDFKMRTDHALKAVRN